MEAQLEIKEMTQKEWHKKGVDLFGEDIFKWKFKCPLCGNIQTPEDFRQYKEDGATPDSASKECIGRYRQDPYKAFGYNKKNHTKSPCDYASYGFFRIGDIIKFDDGTETVVFPFAQESE